MEPEKQAEGPSLYERLGGEAGLSAYVDRFYDIMQNDPSVAHLWAMHRSELGHIKEKLVSFLSGFVGGPVTFPERYGAPMMRQRHLPFPIDDRVRDMWLDCAFRALAATFQDRGAAIQFAQGLKQFADHMRNVE